MTDTWNLVMPNEALRDALGLPEVELPVRQSNQAAIFGEKVDLEALLEDVVDFCEENPEAVAIVGETMALLAHTLAVQAGLDGYQESALYYCDMGLAYRPMNLGLLARRGIALYGLGRLDEGSEAFAEVIADERMAFSPSLWLLAARLEADRGDHRRAYELLKESAQHMPNDNAFWDLLAREKELAGD